MNLWVLNCLCGAHFELCIVGPVLCNVQAFLLQPLLAAAIVGCGHCRLWNNTASEGHCGLQLCWPMQSVGLMNFIVRGICITLRDAFLCAEFN